ncbi:uracil phosphoribosyltransferase [Tenacibaculum piscium]|uniref:Uracil phosphoribosyltransferase n=1 Tax=Tenacibaculum piscium TaxID=1458515 RepID=A0A2H1YKB8_9FLAO|nr:uracil phosphoribosyltransferase [Tenacibaculum piscium]MBE7629367.1 uracil phosphoribosyltransferase [Tenacibaculum piscium]MBE7670154.1 uracil phosphoribosyltransferase [Tenacibaculum piscium]MBE7685422.1 uracil phosphoribosyltransferase [Tenacibaculum piscium]MBE7690006.1 uracil phosphoribosyltransferase [Tenacibaculum piscium]MCG8183181.1 uracil phosphoribosyltransferase [Tenacibaculum piscium]
MKIYHLAKENSILSQFLSEIRNVTVQNDSMRFRRNIERIGEILGYELSKKLSFETQEIQTPLAKKIVNKTTNEIVLCSILRAGIPLHNGLLNYFDNAENAFISAYRHHPNNDEKSEIKVEYFASPSIEGKTVLLIDPMIASGSSLVAVYQAIKKFGTPKEIKIVAVLGAEEGIKHISSYFPENTELWIADIDEKLNEKGYIVPGLGDAGDLAFGTKI